MNARPLRAGASLLAAFVCSGCATGLRDWRELGERALPFEDVWIAVVETAGRHGFPLNDSETDRGNGIYTSRWRSWTQGFGQSRRLRVRAEFKGMTQEAAPMTWEVRFCVERQTVTDMSRSMNPRESDWKADGQERDLEDVIEAQLRMRFGDSEVRPLRSSTRRESGQ